MSEFIDIRQKVLSGEIKPKRKAIYVEALGGWLMLQEPMADKRAQMIQSALNVTTKQMKLDVLYPALIVNMLRYPHPDTAPPLEVDKDGNVTNPLAQQYPFDHPKAGELVFQPNDAMALGSVLPGSVSEDIAMPAATLAAMGKKELDDEKKVSTTTVIDTSAIVLPNASTEQTPNSSSAN